MKAKNKLLVFVCEKCNGTWLDNTEIDRLEKAKLGFAEKVLFTLGWLFKK